MMRSVPQGSLPGVYVLLFPAVQASAVARILVGRLLNDGVPVGAVVMPVLIWAAVTAACVAPLKSAPVIKDTTQSEKRRFCAGKITGQEIFMVLFQRVIPLRDAAKDGQKGETSVVCTFVFVKRQRHNSPLQFSI